MLSMLALIVSVAAFGLSAYVYSLQWRPSKVTVDQGFQAMLFGYHDWLNVLVPITIHAAGSQVLRVGVESVLISGYAARWSATSEIVNAQAFKESVNKWEVGEFFQRTQLPAPVFVGAGATETVLMEFKLPTVSAVSLVNPHELRIAVTLKVDSSAQWPFAHRVKKIPVEHRYHSQPDLHPYFLGQPTDATELHRIDAS